MRRLLLPVFLSLAVALCVAGEEDRALSRLIDRVQAAYDGLASLQAEFTQVLHSSALGRPQEERGLVYLRRPGLMRWEYRAPEPKVLVVDGERTWLYIPAEIQVIVGSLEEVERSGAAGLLLAGSVDLRRDFRIRAGEPPEEAPRGAATLVLKPRAASDAFAAVELTVAGEPLLPVHIRVLGHLGDVMEYRFRGVRTGLPLDEELFRFRPPEGVEVVLAE